MIHRTSFSEWSGSGSPVDITHSTDSYYRGLLVAVHVQMANNSTDNLTVTYNGVALTQIMSQGVGFSPPKYDRMYYLEAPPQGAYTLNLSAPGGSIQKVFAVSYSNVLQSGLINTSLTDVDGGGSDSWTLTTTVADCWIATFMADYPTSTGDNFTGGTNNVLLGTAGDHRFGDSNGGVGVAGAKTVSATYNDGADYWAWLSLALAPATPIPILSTSAVSGIGLRSAVGNGNVEYDGESTITERGFCVSTSPTPTTANTKFTASGTVGDFSANLTSLSVNTTYYVRAYAINASGTAYGNEVSFTTNNITSTELIKDISAVEGATYAVSVNVTGSTGTVTAQLGRDGASAVFTAGGGPQVLQGVYSGSDGLILTRSAGFNGTIDDVMWVRVEGTGTIDWTKTTFTTVFPISSEVFFKRIEDDVFNSSRMYRFLDLLFKDFDGYVTVTLKEEKSDSITTKTKTFSVGNISDPASPFSKKRISMLCKDQAIIIGLSNASLNETFAIAKFVLSGHKRPRRMFGADRIISVG